MCILTETPTAADCLSVTEESDKNTTLFRKTKLCKFHLMGVCSRGSSCNFAHGSGEKQPLPDFHCTKFCPALLEHGTCDNPACTFAHDQLELRRRKPADVLPQEVVSRPAPISSAQSQLVAPPSAQSLAKTRMCKFHMHGQCTKGTTCTFAHSMDELVPMPLGTQMPDEHFVAPEVSKVHLTLEMLTSMDTSQCQTGNETPSSSSPTTKELGIHSTGSFCSTSSTTTSANPRPPMSVAVRVLYFKTKLCKFHARGACAKGTECSFAHDVSELHIPPSALLSFKGLLPQLPTAEGSRLPVPSFPEGSVCLAVRNGFYTVDEEDFRAASSAARRSKSLPARRAEPTTETALE
mmetsp:Transcript_1556/g.4007  ORF Transcript_1556/g.4007 Transcript_1556/m.4007 type:complete len:350 (-) Transcript_1556:71-1120(-)